MTSPVTVRNATGLPAQCAVAQAATVNISDQLFFFVGSHAPDDLSTFGRRARTVAGFLLFDVVRARAMCLSIFHAAGRHTASMRRLHASSAFMERTGTLSPSAGFSGEAALPPLIQGDTHARLGIDLSHRRADRGSARLRRHCR